MANTIRIKRRIGGATGAPSTLGSSELAFNENSGGRILYYGLGDNSFGVATSVIAIGGPDFAVTATTNANLTGHVTSVGNAAVLGSFTSAQLATALTDETGTGANVFATSPTLVTPNIGAATGTSLVLSGSLTVNGSVTTISSTTLSVADKNIELATGSVTDAAADGGGLTLHGLTDHTWNWVLATTSWTSSEHVNVASGKSYYINGTVVLSSTSLGSGIIIDGGTF